MACSLNLIWFLTDFQRGNRDCRTLYCSVCGQRKNKQLGQASEEPVENRLDPECERK